MEIILNPIEARVLGALIEKDMSTPEYYPLSLNALVNACNQKTNRDPVTSLDEDTVAAAVDALRDKELIRVDHGSRVLKYGHRASEILSLGNRELAVMCVLLLRGPQTTGELRGRTQSLHAFDDLDSVETCVRRLMEREPPLAARLPRQPGFKESRYAQLLNGDVPASSPENPIEPNTTRTDRIAALEEAVETLTREVAEIKQQLASLLGR